MMKVFQIYTVYNSHVWDTVVSSDPLDTNKELLLDYIKNSSKWHKEWGDPVNFFAWEVQDAEIEPYTKINMKNQGEGYSWEFGLSIWIPHTQSYTDVLIEYGYVEMWYHKAQEEAGEAFTRWWRDNSSEVIK